MGSLHINPDVSALAPSSAVVSGAIMWTFEKTQQVFVSESI